MRKCEGIDLAREGNGSRTSGIPKQGFAVPRASATRGTSPRVAFCTPLPLPDGGTVCTSFTTRQGPERSEYSTTM